MAEWAARANRWFGGESTAMEAFAPRVDEVVREDSASEPPARRLPFELLDAPPVAVADPPSNGNGDVSSLTPAASAPAGAEPAIPAEAADSAEPTSPTASVNPATMDSEEYLYQAARRMAEQRDPVRAYAEVERDLLAVLDREPSNAEAHFNLGLVTSRRGRWREAVAHLRRAIELDGGRAAAYFYLGEALNHVDDLPGALQAYQRSVELKPSNPKALYGMGIVLDRMNRPDDAAPLYRRSRELHSK